MGRERSRKRAPIVPSLAEGTPDRPERSRKAESRDRLDKLPADRRAHRLSIIPIPGFEQNATPPLPSLAADSRASTPRRRRYARPDRCSA